MLWVYMTSLIVFRLYLHVSFFYRKPMNILTNACAPREKNKRRRFFFSFFLADQSYPKIVHVFRRPRCKIIEVGTVDVLKDFLKTYLYIVPSLEPCYRMSSFFGT